MNSIHILLSTPHDNFTMLLLILLKGVSFRINFFFICEKVKNRLGHFSVASTLFIIIIVIIIIILNVNRKTFCQAIFGYILHNVNMCMYVEIGDTCLYLHV